MEKVIKQLKATATGIRNVAENIENIVIPASIVIASYYNFSTLQGATVAEFERVVRIAASVIPTAVAAYLFWKHFSQKRGK